MKKVLALALALIMMLAIAIPAFAEGEESNTNETANSFSDETAGTVGNTKVEYGVDQSYTVTIPKLITFGSQLKDVEATVSAKDAYLAGNEKLVVSVESATTYTITGSKVVTKDAWEMVDINGISTPVDYWVAKAAQKTATDLVDGVVLEVSRAAGNKGIVGSSGSQALYFSTNGTAQEGSYEDRLTFNVEIAETAPEYTYREAGAQG